jgi:reactive intermediate/imine deaminase|tara:strand:+ start:2258 stop:2689 length:432 start_codon:yes stop_codon:yes gene_type:complete
MLLLSSNTLYGDLSIMNKKIIFTENAPQAIGPYSQGVVAGDTLYISGQIPLNPSTKALVEGTISEQAEQVINNLESICEAANTSLANIVKLNIFLTDLSNFADVNEVMKNRFSEPYPARATVEVSALPLGVDIEMDAIVSLNE